MNTTCKQDFVVSIKYAYEPNKYDTSIIAFTWPMKAAVCSAYDAYIAYATTAVRQDASQQPYHMVNIKY